MEVSYIFCDVCNSERDSLKSMTLHEDTCKVLGVPEGSVALRGVFEGPFAAASSRDGWQERDFGHVCPVCAIELDQVDAAGDTVVGIVELRDRLAEEPETKDS